MIRYLKHTEINKELWDSCIGRSVNRMPYALSWWLDTVCDDWEALVKDDYSAVMPLTRNRKLGFDYLYQPYFTQQLGVFSTDIPGSEEINRFLAAIPATYRYIDIQLNSGNQPADASFSYRPRKNYTLDLSKSHIQLSASYHRNCRRNIQKAVHAGLRVKPGPGPSVFTQFVHRHLDRKLNGLRKNFYPMLQQIVQVSIQNGTGKIQGVYKPGGRLVAAGWFMESAGRFTFLVCASTPEGKKNQAMFLLVDDALREKAGSGLVYDFAGSNLPGISYFNQGFGANESYYTAVKRNLLPWPLRMFKR
jgi:hypothetical protein